MKNNKLAMLPLFLAVIMLVLARPAIADETDRPVPLFLSLADCVTETLAKSPDLELVQAEINRMEAALRSAEKDRYPALSFQYSYSRQPDIPFPAGVENYYNYLFAIEQPLYRGKSLVTAIELAELNVQSAEVSSEKTRNELLFAVHRAYFNLLKAHKLEEVAEQAVVRLQSHRKDAKAFYDAGLIPKNDLLQSELQLAQSEQDLLQSRNYSLLAKASLNLLMQRPVSTSLEIVDQQEFQPRSVEWEAILETAEKLRPELNLADIAISQAEKGIIMATAPFLPSLTLSATYLKQGDDLLADSYPIGPSEIKSATATLQWRFWNWNQKEDQTAVARQSLRKAKLARLQAANQVAIEVREAFLHLKLAEENIGVTRKSIEQAEENFRINQSRYQAQLNTSTEVLDAQTLLTRAKSNYYNALYDYSLALAALDRSTGELGLAGMK